MKIGYGTYGMPEVPIWNALPRLAEIGYEAVEICAADRWPTAPRKLAAQDRERLGQLLEELRLELPALLIFVNLLALAGEEIAAQELLFREACALARDLSPAAPPAIVSPLGSPPRSGSKSMGSMGSMGSSSNPSHTAHTTHTSHTPHTPYTDAAWEETLSLVLERVARFGEIAGSEGCCFALEPHVHGLLDRPERVTYLMERLRSPPLGINFDISHFAVAGYSRAETIRALAPYALHTHVKDGRMVDGKVQFLLPGEGEFDYPAYFREMAAAGYRGCVTAEVSAQIFNRPGYDPWPAARFCLETLRRGRQAALA
jgi:sugar phosphate isomerase/epimerase